MEIYGLYSTSNPDIIRYIGYTTKPLNKRLIEHKSESRYNRTYKDKWIQSEIKENNSIEILSIDSGFSIDELKKKEVRYIKIFKSAGAELVNRTYGGDGALGLKQSEEQKIHNGKLKSKKVYVFDYYTKKFLYEYSSTLKMIKELGLVKSRVSLVLSGKCYKHHEYTFSRDGNYPLNEKKKQIAWNKGKSIQGTYLMQPKGVLVDNGIVNKYFDYAKDAANFIGINRTQIFRYIKEKRKYKDWTITNVRAQIEKITPNTV